MKKQTTKRANKTQVSTTGILCGYAVLLGDYSTEFWKYSPAVLTKQQRNKIGIIGWHKVSEIIERGSVGVQL